jgi:hypothetical protein
MKLLRKPWLTLRAITRRIVYLLIRFTGSRASLLWRYRSDLLFSLKLGTKFVFKIRQDQLELATPEDDNQWRRHATQYQTGSLANFKHFFSNPHLKNQHFDYFFDVGSGLGKYVFFAEKANIARRCVGIENDPVLHLRSLETKKGIRSGSEFIRANALTYRLEIPAQSRCLIFMFNPFDHYVLKEFLTNNLDQFEKTTFLYENDAHIQVFLTLGFRLISKEKNFSLLKL